VYTSFVLVNNGSILVCIYIYIPWYHGIYIYYWIHSKNIGKLVSVILHYYEFVVALMVVGTMSGLFVSVLFFV